MTKGEIRERIAKIEAEAGDDETAHCDEDQLYYDFVEFIALAGDRTTRMLAEEVMRVRDIKFARWHA